MNTASNKKRNHAEVVQRNTPQRALVLEVVKSLSNHPTSAEIFKEASERNQSISKATVYRNLDVLVYLGQLRKIEMPEMAARYDATLRPHGHAYCRRCGSLHDIDFVQSADITQMIADDYGFVIEGYKVVFEGLCPSCAIGKFKK